MQFYWTYKILNLKIYFKTLFLQNYKMAKKYSQNTTIFISYEWVDHIAVYNYMFRPLSV